MTHRRRSCTAVLALATALVASAVAAPVAEAAPTGPIVVASGLNNPRGLSFLPDGSVLLVAEAGTGGPACSDGGPEGEVCVGATGSIDAITAPNTATDVAPNRIITGLLSGAGADGSAAAGPDGVSATSINSVNVIMTYAPPDVIPDGLPGDQAGKLLKGAAYRTPKTFADITAYEVAHDPDGQGIDSNPYSVLLNGNRTLVTDAAANDVLSVDRNGVVSLFATLPNIQTGRCAGQPNDNGTTGCDFVPTSLAVGPDGAVYVGGLGGLTPGAGRVVKLDPVTGAIKKTYVGLTSVTGIAVAKDGALYASQLSFDPSKGKVTRISADLSTRTEVPVPFPAGLAIDPRTGSVFVSAFSIAPSTGLGFPNSSGQVWKLRFPAPTAAA